jgi:hypothetical protein
MTAGAKPDIDEAGARRFLAGWCGHGPGAVELVGEGEWSRCFAFTRDGRELVVRFGRHVDDFAKDRMAAAWSGQRYRCRRCSTSGWPKTAIPASAPRSGATNWPTRASPPPMTGPQNC